MTLKQISIILLLGSALTLAACNASTTATIDTGSSTSSTEAPVEAVSFSSAAPTMTSGYVMEEGKMVVITDQGEKFAMEKDVELQNGTTIAVDGTVTMPDGTAVTLKNGDGVSAEGQLVIVSSAALDVVTGSTDTSSSSEDAVSSK